jgi:hypothetical protein
VDRDEEQRLRDAQLWTNTLDQENFVGEWKDSDLWKELKPTKMERQLRPIQKALG